MICFCYCQVIHTESDFSVHLDIESPSVVVKVVSTWLGPGTVFGGQGELPFPLYSVSSA